MMGKKITHAAFWIICGLLSVYLVALQFLTYLENADAPKISFRKFNKSPDDVYPDITFCFRGIYGNIYKESYIKQQYSLNKLNYNKLLSGDSKTWGKVPNASRVANGNFEKALVDLEDLLVFYQLGLHDVVSPLKSHQVMHRTYQTAERICFTRKLETHLTKGDLVTMERFRVRLTHVYLQVFIHYPGETMRTVFGMDRIYKTALTMTKQELNESNHREIKLSQMTVLKKRPDAVDPCDPNPSDDTRFWEEVFARLSCLPSYWKKFAPANTNLLECRTWNEFEELFNLTYDKELKTQIREKESILSSLATTCNEMGIVVTSQTLPQKTLKKIKGRGTKKSKRSVKKNSTKKNKKTSKSNSNPNSKKDDKKATKKDIKHEKSEEENDVLIRILYNMNKYQEIKNEKDFGLDSLWSNIGGFVGIFIGYSLLNLLDDVYDLTAYLFRVNSSHERLQRISRNEPHGA